MPYCRRCEQEKPHVQFQTDNSRILRVMSICRACNRHEAKLRKKRAKLRRFLATVEP